MKKFFLVFAMMAMTVAVNAQFEAGKTFVGASVTGLDLNYNGARKWSIGVEGRAGQFITDNWLLFGQLGYQHRGDVKQNDFKIGVGGRYYILQNGIFLGANANYVHETKNYNDFVPAIEIGYSFFVSRSVTIEPALYYEQSINDHKNRSTIGLKVGLGIYLPKNKIQNSVKEAFK
ncbi:MAG: outer membrane beta-barrel protein [Prevotella sp.]|nr:outer membrane beta-barrel protein [Prevotella sp.]